MSTGQIGIKTANGEFYPILSAEAGVSQKRLVLTTVRDDQATVQIDLYQSSDDDPKSPGPYVGSLIVENIAPAPAGEPDINLTVGVDADGNLNSTAMDTASGAYQSLSVGLEALSEDQVFEVPDFALDEEQFEDQEVEDAFDDVDTAGPDESSYEEGGYEPDGYEEDEYVPAEYGSDQDDDEFPSYDGFADEEAQEEAAGESARPAPLLMAGFLVISLALVGLLTYLVFLALQTPPAPPLEAAWFALFLVPDRLLARLRRRKRIDTQLG